MCICSCVSARESVSGCECVWTSDDDDDDDYELQPAYYVQRPQRLAERTLPLKHWQLQVEVRTHTHTHTGTRTHRHIRTLVHLTKTESTAASNASAQLRRQRERQRQRQRQRRRRRWSQKLSWATLFSNSSDPFRWTSVSYRIGRASAQPKPSQANQASQASQAKRPNNPTTQQPIDQPAK